MNNKKENMIVTIDTELGSGGERVAYELSRLLQIPCYGQEILDLASELSGISQKLMNRSDGHIIHAAYDLQADDVSKLRIPPASDFAAAKILACQKLANQGACILVDRHASKALEGNSKHVSIFIHANTEERLSRFAENAGLSRDKAGSAFKKAERGYSESYMRFYNKWGEADGYDLSLNSSDAEASVLAEIIYQFLDVLTGGAGAAQKKRKAS